MLGAKPQWMRNELRDEVRGTGEESNFPDL